MKTTSMFGEQSPSQVAALFSSEQATLRAQRPGAVVPLAHRQIGERHATR